MRQAARAVAWFGRSRRYPKIIRRVKVPDAADVAPAINHHAACWTARRGEAAQLQTVLRLERCQERETFCIAAHEDCALCRRQSRGAGRSPRAHRNRHPSAASRSIVIALFFCQKWQAFAIINGCVPYALFNKYNELFLNAANQNSSGKTLRFDQRSSNPPPCLRKIRLANCHRRVAVARIYIRLNARMPQAIP